MRGVARPWALEPQVIRIMLDLDIPCTCMYVHRLQASEKLGNITHVLFPIGIALWIFRGGSFFALSITLWLKKLGKVLICGSCVIKVTVK